MELSKFNELTKALATATTRREALRRIGGILGGTALAGLFPGLALAGTSACAHFCNTVFGGDTPASAQCAADAAHHKGLCYTCGPASPGGTQTICCRESNGLCTSYSSATCCSSGLTCFANGTCAMPCYSEFCCGNNNYFCDQLSPGFNYFCVDINSGGSHCGSDLDCPPGMVCDGSRGECKTAVVC